MAPVGREEETASSALLCGVKRSGETRWASDFKAGTRTFAAQRPVQRGIVVCLDIGNAASLSRMELVKNLSSSGRQLNLTSVNSGFSDGIQNKGWIWDTLREDKSYRQWVFA